MKRTSLLLSALFALSLLAGPAGADATDYDFAKGLMERGYFDLAEREFVRMGSDKSLGPDQRLEGELGLAFLKAKVAINEFQSRKPKSDPAPIIAIFDEAETLFNGFFSKAPNHPRITEARFELGRLRQNKGALFRTAMGETDDSVAAEQYKSGAESAFDNAIELYDGIIAKYERKQDEWFYPTARYWKGVAIYEKGLIYSEEDLARRSVLKQALDHWESYIWDYDGSIGGIYGYMYKGLAHKELKEYPESLEFLQTAANIDPDEVDTDDENQLYSVLLLAYYHLGVMCNEVGEIEINEQKFNLHKIAAETLAKMPEKIPTVYEIKIGHRALVELARAYMGINEFEKALAVAQKVSASARGIGAGWAHGTGIMADRLIGEIMATASRGNVKLVQDPKVLWRAAEGKLSQRDFVAAAQAYQQVIVACGEAPEHLDQKIEAWLKLASCFYRAEGDRYYEAAAATQVVLDDFKDHEMAGDASYYRYVYLLGQYRFSRDDDDLKRFQAARKQFTDDYSTHAKAKDLAYFEAVESLDKGRDLLAAGKKEAGRKLLLEAERQLKAVDETSGQFELAQVRKGQVFYEMGEIDASADAKAIRYLEAYLEKVRDPKGTWITTNPDRLAKRTDAKARATYYIAKIHERRKRYAKVISSLEDYRRKHKGAKDYHPRALLMVVLANLNLKKEAEAEQTAAILIKDYHDQEEFVRRAVRAMQIYYENRLRTVEGDVARKPLLVKASTFGERYLNLIPEENQTEKELLRVAQRFHELDQLDKALAFFERLLEKAKPVKVADRETASWLFRLCRIYMAQDQAKNALPWLERLCCRRGDDMKAVEAMAKLLAQVPGKVKPNQTREVLTNQLVYLQELIRAYGTQGGYYQAINVCRRLLSNPTSEFEYSTDWFWTKYWYCLMWYEYGRQNPGRIPFENADKTLENLIGLGLLDRFAKKAVAEQDEAVRSRMEQLVAKIKQLHVNNKRELAKVK